MGMRRAGRLAAESLEFITPHVRPGVTTNRLNQLLHDFTLKNGATPAPLGYKGFPKSICTSVNDCMCHGVPDDRLLEDGDFVNIDVTPVKDGYYGDASFTFPVGNASPEGIALCRAAVAARNAGIAAIGPDVTTGHIGAATEKYIRSTPYSICREIGGHGIGKVFHGDPFVPAYGKPGEGTKLQPWICITVEPIVHLEPTEMVEYAIPRSSIKYYHTESGCLSAQSEHTVLVTESGHEILTKWSEPSL